MSRIVLPRAQRGATLVVGLIMLVIITLVVTSAFMMSNTNLKSVGNMQIREETVAAANVAIEQVLGSPFTAAPAAEEINVDINADGAVDYVVQIASPQCIRASEIVSGVSVPGSGSSVSLGLPAGPPPDYMTVWDIDATVNDASSGATVQVRQGVRVLLSKVEKDAVCP